MARFVRAKLSTYDSLGMPTLDGEEAWLNVDQIIHIEEHLGNNLLRRYQHDGAAPEQHYPCLLVTTSDGRERLISLGIAASVEDGTAALQSGLSNIIGDEHDGMPTSAHGRKGANTALPETLDGPIGT
jgi:hypothetical protein